MDSVFAPQEHGRPLRILERTAWPSWWAELPDPARGWLAAVLGGSEPQSGQPYAYPDRDGLPAAVAVFDRPPGIWDLAALRGRLPPLDWSPQDHSGLVDTDDLALGWALDSYRFTAGRRPDGERHPRICVRPSKRVRLLADAIFLARDLVNTPANRMGPDELEAAAADLASRFGATLQVLRGEELLRANYPAIHAVGRASAREPRLLDLRWGEEGLLRLTLVGKGVCFDTGGLDLKPAHAMALMKKDMGGAAVALGLARAVMAAELPLRLRVLIPAVENAVSGSAFRPGDVLETRSGLTVEIGNTDAEGRLVLADALTEAGAERPALLIDLATLTGAARIALGPDLPALFTPEDALARQLVELGARLDEPLWQLPLHAPYARYLESRIADLDNAGRSRHAGAITAALFLRRFVEEGQLWAHLDIYAWNEEDRPGRPRGGEASALRPLFAWIEKRFGQRPEGGE